MNPSPSSRSVALNLGLCMHLSLVDGGDGVEVGGGLMLSSSCTDKSRECG